MNYNGSAINNLPFQDSHIEEELLLQGGVEKKPLSGEMSDLA